MVELTDIDTTLEIISLREKYFDSPKTLQLELAKRSDRMKQFAPGMLPNHYVIGDEFFTQCEHFVPTVLMPSYVLLWTLCRPFLPCADIRGTAAIQEQAYPFGRGTDLPS